MKLSREDRRELNRQRRRDRRRRRRGMLLLFFIVLLVILALILKRCQDGSTETRLAPIPQPTDPPTVPTPDKSRRVNDDQNRFVIHAPIDWVAFFANDSNPPYGTRVIWFDGKDGRETMNFIADPSASTAGVAEVRAKMKPMLGSAPLTNVTSNNQIAAQGKIEATSGNDLYVRCWAHAASAGAKVNTTGYWCLTMFRTDMTQKQFDTYANTIQFLQ